MNIRYLLSLPERAIRAAAAGAGGLLYEATLVLLPEWLRRSRLYRVTVAGALRIIVELVGDVEGVLPRDDISAGELAVRKAAGTGIEIAGLATLGWSPLWLLAAAADLTGGTRTYLRALVVELQRTGVLPQDASVDSIEGLLNNLERVSGLMAETVDTPPLRVRDLRQYWHALKQKRKHLPDAARQANIYAQLQEVAKREGHSLWTVSSLIALGAVRAGAQTGRTLTFDYYRNALGTIRKEGLTAYTRRVTRPYLAAAGDHFDATRVSYTERLLGRRPVQQPGAADEDSPP